MINSQSSINMLNMLGNKQGKIKRGKKGERARERERNKLGLKRREITSFNNRQNI